MLQSSKAATLRKPSRNGIQPNSTDRTANPIQLPIGQTKEDSPSRAHDQGEPTASKVTDVTM